MWIANLTQTQLVSINHRPDALHFMRQSVQQPRSHSLGKGEPNVLHYSFQAHTV